VKIHQFIWFSKPTVTDGEAYAKWLRIYRRIGCTRTLARVHVAADEKRRNVIMATTPCAIIFTVNVFPAASKLSYY